MTWSSQQIDSLPGGVRALPRPLRAAWAGAASAARGRGSSTAEARKHGDAVVGLFTRGLADIGLTPDALEGWSSASSDHALAVAMASDGFGAAVGRAFRRPRLADASVDGPGDLASWLADAVGRADVERSEEEQADIRERFPRSDYVNMTPSDMDEWGESPFAGQNRKEGDEAASAREALADVKRLKEKRMEEWTEADYDDAVEALAFIDRMREVEQGEPLTIEGREGPSARDASLKDWGHDPAKADAGTDAMNGEEDRATDGASVLDSLRRRFRATVVASATAAASVAGGYTDAADRVWRTDRIALELDGDSRAAVDKAIAYADRKGERANLADAVDALRADGLDKYITPEGYLRVRARAARDGVQLYSDGVDVWGEYRPSEEVFSSASLASWDYKPFTDDHPSDFVGIDNWHQYACGVVGNARKVAGPDGRSYVEVDILVASLDSLIKIREGKVELSAGYSARLRQERGRDMHGDAYEYRHADIYINHLSLVDLGRAGPLARITVDGFAWQVDKPQADAVGTEPIQQQDNSTMQTEDKIKVQLADGVEVEMTREQHDAWTVAEAKRNADSAAAEQPKVDAIQAKVDAMAAQADAMKAQVDALATAKATTDAKLLSLEAENARLKADADARQRAEVIDTIKAVCPTLDLGKLPAPKGDDGKDLPVPLADCKAAAVVDLAPHFRAAIDSYRSQDAAAFAAFVDTLFAAEVSKARSAPTGERYHSDHSHGEAAGSSSNVTDLNALRDNAFGRRTA